MIVVGHHSKTIQHKYQDFSSFLNFVQMGGYLQVGLKRGLGIKNNKYHSEADTYKLLQFYVSNYRLILW